MKYKLNGKYLTKQGESVSFSRIFDTKDDAYRYGVEKQWQFKSALFYVDCGLLTLKVKEVVGVYSTVEEVEE